MKAVHNERVKLLATALNNLGVATIVTGLIGPLVSSLYGLTTPSAGHRWWLLAAVWLACGIILHLGAVDKLRDLRD